MTIRNLIFDLDGTLFVTDTVTVPAVQSSLRERNLPAPSRQEICSTFGRPAREFHAWLRTLCPEEGAQALLETIDRESPDWEGHVGVITTLFPQLDITSPKDTVAVVVGPPIMYRFVIIECLNAGIDEANIIMSLERHMKCGVGKCGHCQINQKYVCLDGPVFSYAEARHLKEAI